MYHHFNQKCTSCGSFSKLVILKLSACFFEPTGLKDYIIYELYEQTTKKNIHELEYLSGF